MRRRAGLGLTNLLIKGGSWREAFVMHINAHRIAETRSAAERVRMHRHVISQQDRVARASHSRREANVVRSAQSG